MEIKKGFFYPIDHYMFILKRLYATEDTSYNSHTEFTMIIQ